MKRQTLVFVIALLLVVTLVFWFGLALPEAYRNSDAIAATSAQSFNLTLTAIKP